MFGDVNALEGLHVTGKYRDKTLLVGGTLQALSSGANRSLVKRWGGWT